MQGNFGLFCSFSPKLPRIPILKQIRTKKTQAHNLIVYWCAMAGGRLKKSKGNSTLPQESNYKRRATKAFYFLIHLSFLTLKYE